LYWQKQEIYNYLNGMSLKTPQLTSDSEFKQFGSSFQELINSLSSSVGNDVRLAEKVSDVFERVVLAVINSINQDLATSKLNGISILKAGSLARKRAHANSDIDIVILCSSTYSSYCEQLRTLLTKAFHQIGFPNSDIVICQFDGESWLLPPEAIDRRIVLASRYLLGDTSLVEKFRCVRNSSKNRWDAFVTHTILRFASQNSALLLDPLKYGPGGKRDVIAILNLMDKTIVGKKLYLLPNMDNVYDTARIADDVFIVSKKNWPTQQVNKAYTQFEEAYISSISQKLFFEFQWLERVSSMQLLGVSEMKRIMDGEFAFQLGLIALSRVNLLNSNIIQQAPASFEGLRLLAVSQNPKAPADYLHYIYGYKGYKWRNLRDQVLKNPSISQNTLESAMNDSSAFTRARARKIASLSRK